MEDSYNWELILKVAIPVAVIEAVLFYFNIKDFWRWAALILGLFATGMVVYIYDKRKNTVFTAISIVLLVVLIVRFFKNLGLF